MKRLQFASDYQKSRSYAPMVITEGGRIAWLAGLLAPEDEDGKPLAGDFREQVRCVFRKMTRQMEEAGGSLDDVVTMTGFITDVRYNLDFVEVRKEFFNEDFYPASTLVTVQALNRPEALVEVTAIAVLA
ncbi:MAG: RidA family protein [Alphaproteobacteria bacterium]|nr:RidA family protein [Alphaproteobacteria bacterium]